MKIMASQTEYSKSVWPIFGIFLTLTAFAVSSNVIPPLITTIANEMAVNFTNFGYIVMFQFFSFFIAGLLGGWACEHHRVNSRILVLIGLLVVVITLLVGSTLTSLRMFIIWAVPLGIGGGLVETFGSILVSNLEKPHSSKLLNMSQVFFCIGAIFAPQIVAVMLYLKISWGHIFILFGLLILLIMCIFFFMTRKVTQVIIHPVRAANNFSTPLLKDSLFFLLAATLLVYVTFESVVACWVSVYFEKRFYCTVHSSALRLSIYWIGLIFGRLAVTVIPRRFTLWPAMFIGISIMCVSAFLVTFTFSPSLATVFVFLNGFGSGPLWPTTVAICHAARNRPRFTSSVIAIGAIGVVLGSGLGAVLFRYLDFSIFFLFVAFGCIMLLVLSFFSYRKYYKNKALRYDLPPFIVPL
jgi:MFS transporter, FHS family, glucose/mannose:H+ symporter